MSTPTTAELEEAIQALIVLRTQILAEQKQSVHTLRAETQTLRQESHRFRQDVQEIVAGAGAGIKQVAEQSLQPVSKQYRETVATLTGHVGKANNMVMTWLAGAVGVVLLSVLVLWGVLGYYRRELAAEQAKLENYENANQVLDAYRASDATVCGGMLCIKPGNRHGDYRQAKPRETGK